MLKIYDRIKFITFNDSDKFEKVVLLCLLLCDPGALYQRRQIERTSANLHSFTLKRSITYEQVKLNNLSKKCPQLLGS